MKKTWLLFFGLIVLSTTVHAETKEDIKPIITKKITDSIYMLHGQGGNIGVSIGEDGIILIDDQFEPAALKIEEALRKISDKPIKYVLNTHFHHDHTDGNRHFGKFATIIAHEEVRRSLEQGREIKFFDKVIEPQPAHALPDITFDDSLTMHFNNSEILVLHFPYGHTDSDSVIFFLDENVVHVGDHFFNGMYPFIDLDSNGSIEGLIDNLELLLEMIPKDATIIPGHGPLAYWDDLNDYLQMIILCSEFVREQMLQGYSLKDIKANGFPEDIEERWGKGFLSTDKFIAILHKGLLD